MQTGALHRPRPTVRAGARPGLQAGFPQKVLLKAYAKLQTCGQAALHPRQPEGAQDCPGQNPQEGLRRMEDYSPAKVPLVDIWNVVATATLHHQALQLDFSTPT